MNAKQYTIRNIPPKVDRYLRKRARLSGKSLNEVVVAELSASAGVSKEGLAGSLDWFIGSGSLDDQTLKAIDSAKQEQKRLAAKEMGLDT
jgi:hypothetical protein